MPSRARCWWERCVLSLSPEVMRRGSRSATSRRLSSALGSAVQVAAGRHPHPETRVLGPGAHGLPPGRGPGPGQAARAAGPPRVVLGGAHRAEVRLPPGCLALGFGHGAVPPQSEDTVPLPPPQGAFPHILPWRWVPLPHVLMCCWGPRETAGKPLNFVVFAPSSPCKLFSTSSGPAVPWAAVEVPRLPPRRENSILHTSRPSISSRTPIQAQTGPLSGG